MGNELFPNCSYSAGNLLWEVNGNGMGRVWDKCPSQRLPTILQPLSCLPKHFSIFCDNFASIVDIAPCIAPCIAPGGPQQH